tara:strand:- start:3118 stop:3546 length:429 start_codon:yes stop_codon:yes gene_type:complete
MRLVSQDFLPNEEATLNFARELVVLIKQGDLIFLSGQLGAGKTTLVRGLLRFWGYDGPVKSPTYTLLEPYETEFSNVYHFDFYRIEDSIELSFIGTDELIDSEAVKLIEWAENVSDELPQPNLKVFLEVEASGRKVRIYQNG